MSQVITVHEEVDADRALLGNKGAGLVRMLASGLRVPPAFVITTDACRSYLATGALPAGLLSAVDGALAELEARRGLRLGDPEAPLLLSVRSGAPVSMPGMMDTVLDLGGSAATRPALARRGDPRFALDSHRRFLESFGTVVLGIPQQAFDAVPDGDPEMRIAAITRLCAEHGFVDDPRAQLRVAIEAVFRSWNSPRAQAYRRLQGISDDLGTAVVVQAMVFGNLDDRSGTGVVFTRDPNTGAAALYGDFLFRAQGEDVVAGRHATLPVAVLADRLPDIWAELGRVLRALERQSREMLDIEFTVESGTLYVLQMRSGKRAAAAAVRIAVELAQEGVIDRAEAVRRIGAVHLERLARPHLDPLGEHHVLATGLGASPGVASGRICLTADDVADVGDEGAGVVLTRAETSPSDVHGMAVADGILTATGGLVSHAAVVARDLGVPAVVGVAGMVVDEAAGCVRIGDVVLRAGDVVTIDGASGEVVAGRARTVAPAACPELQTLLGWADELAGGAAGGSPAARLAAGQRALEPVLQGR
ncbi:pyruvate, phosphate dikinase [Pseudonocardia sp. GCM10023141]|uniref:pyruvate, phosphate dikinase n=1 Tax=Pseudonocardia sp. GCM10023141 TaxID=3252653 RepID=UPI00361F388E